MSQKKAHGSECVIAYASRVLSKPERCYCVTRKELLAAVTFIKHFRPYLLGNPFVLFFDMVIQFKESRRLVSLMAFQEYNFSIEHRKGRLHGNADAMSRRPCTQCGRDSHSNVSTEGVPIAQIVQETTIPARSNEEIWKLQLENPSIGFMLRVKETNEHPNPDVIKGQSLTIRRLM